MEASVIIATFNKAAHLRRVLQGYLCQDVSNFEVVIADDGSDDSQTINLTRQLGHPPLQIRRVWQENRGFQKCSILNKAIRAARGEYLIFSDDDCVPRANFVSTHLRLARPSQFLSGGTIRLTPEISAKVDRDSVANGSATDLRWLVRQGARLSWKWYLVQTSKTLGCIADFLTPTRATFNGHNASAWKRDILDVNGFDERMVYGGLDRELGERLKNNGVRGRQIRHRAICVHLHHEKSYVTVDGLLRNREIWDQTRQEGVKWTPYGIEPQVLQFKIRAARGGMRIQERLSLATRGSESVSVVQNRGKT